MVRKVDSIKNENHNIGVMEQEKDSLKQTVAQMKATIDSLQKTQSKQVRNKVVSLATTIVETWLFILKHKLEHQTFKTLFNKAIQRPQVLHFLNTVCLAGISIRDKCIGLDIC